MKAKYVYIGAVLCTAFALIGCSSKSDRYAFIENSVSDFVASESHEVTTKIVKKIVDNDFKTEEQYDDSVENGKKQIVQKGVVGQSEITFEITYRDGKEISKKAVSERIIREPINEIILIGSLENRNEESEEVLAVKPKEPIPPETHNIRESSSSSTSSESKRSSSSAIQSSQISSSSEAPPVSSKPEISSSQPEQSSSSSGSSSSSSSSSEEQSSHSSSSSSQESGEVSSEVPPTP